MCEDAIGLLSMQLSLMLNQNLTSLVLCDVRSSDRKKSQKQAQNTRRLSCLPSTIILLRKFARSEARWKTQQHKPF